MRPLKTISGRAIILEAIQKLRENDFDLLLIESPQGSSEARPLVISGYSIVSKMMQMNPHNYAAFLNSPCVESSLLAGTIGATDDLLSLLHVFQSSTFGFALVHGRKSQFEKISVKDLLKLYHLGIFSSKLMVDDVVTSPVFQLSRGTKLDKSLNEIGRRKFRRVQISGTRIVVSDKQILAYLFQQERLGHILRFENRLLDGTLDDIELGEVPWIDGRNLISEAAELLSLKTNDCGLTDRGIVTPWDLTVKTWELGQLNIAKPTLAP